MSPPPITAWWLRFPGKEDQAARILKKFKPAIESKARWLDRHYPGIDWLPTFYYVAYKAAFMCNHQHEWPLIKKCLDRAVSAGLKTYKRRTAKLSRVPLEEEGLWYEFHSDE